MALLGVATSLVPILVEDLVGFLKIFWKFWRTLEIWTDFFVWIFYFQSIGKTTLESWTILAKWLGHKERMVLVGVPWCDSIYLVEANISLQEWNKPSGNSKRRQIIFPIFPQWKMRSCVCSISTDSSTYSVRSSKEWGNVPAPNEQRQDDKLKRVQSWRMN